MMLVAAFLLFGWFWWLMLRLLLCEPHVFIGGRENPYLLRWYVIPRNPLFNIYLHKFLRDDDDRALHDHPWASMSIVLRGKYMEFVPEFPQHSTRMDMLQIHIRRAGHVIFRRATHAHRIALFRRTEYLGEERHRVTHLPAWTLFVTGWKVREWGFHCPKGWRHWKDFCDPSDSSKIGKGCE